LALATLAGVTVLVALVSEVFVESVQQAAVAFGMTPAFVGFIVLALVGGAAEMAPGFSAAGKNRMDLSVNIGLGAASPKSCSSSLRCWCSSVTLLARPRWTCNSGRARWLWCSFRR